MKFGRRKVVTPSHKTPRALIEPLEKRTMLAITPFRPPSVPLIANDPYLSVWSDATNLTDSNTKHWTGAEQSLVSLIRVDGTAYRLMGDDPSTLPAFPQVGVSVLPTRSIYEFQNAQIHVQMIFMTAALPSNLDALTQPASYIVWNVHSVDGATHSVQIYDSTSSELAVNTTDQTVNWQRESIGGQTQLRFGTVAQTYFQPAGDGVRIDWGYVYEAANTAQSTSAIGADSTLLSSFSTSGTLPTTDDTNQPRAVNTNTPVMAFAFNLGNVGSATVSRHVIIALDEIYNISYFGEKLQPYWARNGETHEQMLLAAEANFNTYSVQCATFDSNLMSDLTNEGGVQYAQIAALAYRQALAGNGISADKNGQPLMFTKENSSNGDISTVDVIFPMFPMMLLMSPALAEAALVPVLDYSASPHWTFQNAPHDLGTYPVVTGRDDGGEAMPVEESGNMLIMMDAIAKITNSTTFANKYWPQLTQWAQYLSVNGLDPGNQLSTDDFLGPIAHNTNLSVKAIEGLAAYADLASRRGDSSTATTYSNMAHSYATQWMTMATDGNHYGLAFGDPNTWSEKYNLVWDTILNLNAFPTSVASTEVSYYLSSQMNAYGVPVDSRSDILKVDWTVWTATLATNLTDFESFITPVWNYMTTTGNRSPENDSYTTTNVNSSGFTARPVIGGVFIKMLADPTIWSKYASQAATITGNWAPLPTVTVVVPTSTPVAQTWKYTTTAPTSDWIQPAFNDSSWSSGPGGFGTAGTPGAVVGTNWSTADIWMRRTFIFPSGSFTGLELYVYHDEDVEIYFNGILAASAAGYVTNYTPLDISPAALALLQSGAQITMAVHCHQTSGGQGVDVGIVTLN